MFEYRSLKLYALGYDLWLRETMLQSGLLLLLL